MIPDGEAIIGKYLREHPTVKALGARVAGETPGDQSKPWVRITQLDAPSDSRAEHLIAWLGQFDCYAGAAGGQAEASTVTRTVRAALSTMNLEDLPVGVVTGARFDSCPRIPDDDFEPARQRYILTATVWLHS